MKDLIKEYEERINSVIMDYYNQFSNYILMKDSQKYRELSTENSKLQDCYPIITDVIENRTMSNDFYSKEELNALAKYYENKMRLEDMERMEIFRMGLRTGIKIFYSS